MKAAHANVVVGRWPTKGAIYRLINTRKQQNCNGIKGHRGVDGFRKKFIGVPVIKYLMVTTQKSPYVSLRSNEANYISNS